MNPTGKSVPTLRIGTNGNKTAVVESMQEKKARQNNRYVNGIMLYLILVLLFCMWFLFDTWSSNLVVMKMIGITGKPLEDPLLRTLCFTMNGGAFGGILYHIRMLFKFHTKNSFDERWLGKYMSAPFESAAMALVVLALVRGGVALFGGTSGGGGEVNDFAALGTGALVGLGMRDVVGWVGSIVRSIFVTPPQSSEEDSSKKQSAPPENPSPTTPTIVPIKQVLIVKDKRRPSSVPRPR